MTPFTGKAQARQIHPDRWRIGGGRGWAGVRRVPCGVMKGVQTRGYGGTWDYTTNRRTTHLKRVIGGCTDLK